jgi:hypothetical protein
MAKQVIALGTNPDDRTGTGLRTGGDMINDNFTELYATNALYYGLGLKFKTVTINAGFGGDLDTPAALLVAPGTIKLDKIAFIMAAIFPTTPLNVGGQNLCITYGTNPRQHAIGYFSGAFLQSATNRVFDMTPATGETADTIFSMPVQGGYAGNELYENLGIYAGLSDGNGPASGGVASITFYIWYFECALLETVGIGGDPIPLLPQIMTTIVASQVSGIDGSVPLYVCAHPTNPIDLPLIDTAMLGNVKISNIGVAAVTIHSLTGPGTVLIAGNAGIYLNQNESVELALVKLNGTVQFIVLNGTVNISV